MGLKSKHTELPPVMVYFRKLDYYGNDVRNIRKETLQILKLNIKSYANRFQLVQILQIKIVD